MASETAELVRGDVGLQVVCAWCGTVKRKGDTARVSHGICLPCAEMLTLRIESTAGPGSAA